MASRDSTPNRPGPSSRVVRILVILVLLPGCAVYAQATSPRPQDGPADGGRPVPAIHARPVLGPAGRFDPPTGASSTPSIPPPAQELPIDLPAALRLADSANPVIGEARSRIAIALANLTSARALLLPTLNAGSSYHGHTGVYQRSAGSILNVSDQALYFGGGAEAVAQGTVTIPAVIVSAALTDALYEPLAARQRVDVVRFDASATANAVLLEVATLYQDLHRAGALLQVRRRSEADAAEVVKVTAGYARVGQGRQADADRARTEQQLIRASIRRAEEVATASSALSRRLHLDPSIRLIPAGDPLAVLMLIDPAADQNELIAVATRRRPEVEARSAAIGEAETRLRQEQARPFLPTLWLGGGGGAFGGGSNLVPPTMGRFGGRADFDVAAYWTLEDFGLGNLARQRRRRAEVGAATALGARTIALVREEVAAARADALARREQIGLAVDELAASGEGFRLDLERARQASGLPIELLNNLDLLIKAREDLVQAVIGFNRAQLRLFVALGAPPPLEIPSAPVPPPAEVAADPREAVDPVTQARQEALNAAGEYDRTQARIMETLAEGKPAARREDLIAGLKALAEAHRKVVATQSAYDRSKLDRPGEAPTPLAVQPVVPAGPSDRGVSR